MNNQRKHLWEFLNSANQWVPVTLFMTSDKAKIHFRELNASDFRIRKESSFIVHGFKAPNFNGEIFKKTRAGYIGCIYYPKGDVPVVWGTDGRCRENNNLSLVLDKKEWYQEAHNFPKYCIQLCEIGDTGQYSESPLLFHTIADFNRFGGDYRVATKEEVLMLLVEEV